MHRLGETGLRAVPILVREFRCPLRTSMRRRLPPRASESPVRTAFFIWLVAALVLTVASTARADTELDAWFSRDVVIIVGSGHACYRFDVWLALNDRQRQRGLMFVRELHPMSGMLFVYDEPALYSMWMKNTYLPLDMLFIRGDGSIASIARNAEPRSLRSIEAREPVRYVLELNAGVAADLTITTDSYMIWEPVRNRDP